MQDEAAHTMAMSDAGADSGDGADDGDSSSAAFIGDATYQYRLALVMTGGVSLAIWMGGVTAEIFRAVKGEGLYGRLLTVLDAEATVDVVTGASAGGLNGVFLSSAISRDLPIEEFDSLRDVWMSSGSFMALLRNPRERNPPSILRGDEYFRPEIERVLRRWLRHPPTGLADGRHFDLILTATTLTAELIEHADDRGTPIQEPVHRARFRFDERNLSVAGEAESKVLARQLALAARTSASFPGVFEASFVPVNTPDGDLDMAGIASFKKSRWAIDGGVLVNKPIRPALDIIRGRRPDRDGRRVLFYINPDPSDSNVDVVDTRSDPPTMAAVVSKALISLPRVESVAADLDDLRLQNAAVRSQRSTREDLLLRPDLTGDLVELATRLYPLWRRQRDQAAVAARLRRHFEEVGGALNRPVVGNHDGTAAASYTWGMLDLAMCAEREAQQWLPPEFPTDDELGRNSVWRCGFEPLEYLCSVALDLVRRALQVDPADIQSNRLLKVLHQVQEVRSGIALLRETDSDYWRRALAAGPRGASEMTVPEHFARRLYDTWPSPPAAALAEDSWLRLARYLGDIGAIAAPGRNGGAPGRVALDIEGFARLALGADAPDSAALPAALRTVVRHKELLLAHVLAKAVSDLRTELSKRPRALGEQPVSLLVEAMTTATTSRWSMQAVLQRMFALYVVHSLTEKIDEVEGLVDFVQISADVDCPIDPGRAGAADKVAGIQLGHFGAFFKESWRANDWMWGRLDGATQLIAAFLDPTRLRRQFPNPGAALEAIRTIAVADNDAHLEARWQRSEQAIAAELDKLFADGTDPEQFQLLATVRALQTTVQLQIAQDELPDVADAVTRSYSDGANQSSAARRFVTSVQRARDQDNTTALPLDRVAKLLSNCDVGREAIRDEIGHDLLTATASTAAAVSVTALGGQRSGVSVLRPALATVRTVVMAAYLVAQNAVKRSRTAFAFTQLLLVFAVGAFAVKLLGGEIGTPLVIIAIPIIAAWVLITSLTVGAWWAALILVPASIVIGWTFLDRCDATEAFGGQLRCPAGDAPPDWRTTVAWLLPALALLLTCIVVGFYLHNWIKARRAARREGKRLVALLDKARAAARQFLQSSEDADADVYRASSAAFVRAVTRVHQPIRRARTSTLIAAGIGAVSIIGLRWAADYLLNNGTHQPLINATDTAHQWRAVIYLLGLPLLLLVLTVIRLIAIEPARSVTTRPSFRMRANTFRNEIEDRRAATAIAWFRWDHLPRLSGAVTQTWVPGGELRQGRKWERTGAAGDGLADTPQHLADAYKSLAALDNNSRQVARALIPRSLRGQRADRRARRIPAEPALPAP